MDSSRLGVNEDSVQKIILSENSSKILLKKYSIPVVNELLVTNTEEAVHAAREIGFPVVLKGHGPGLSHKTDQDLVFLNLMEPEAVRTAASGILKRKIKGLDGLLVQPQKRGKREFVAGMFRDRQFGPVIMFGLGGVFTEALRDISFRAAPLTKGDALEMIEEIKAKVLLSDYRGEAAANKNQLIQTLLGLSELACKQPEILEVDINPLLIGPDGDICAVDALVVLKKKHVVHEFPPPIDPKRLGAFFHPRSIAFVGVSAQIGKWGHILFTNTAGGDYTGEIYLVNPKGGTIAERKVYRSVLEIPHKVDLAVVTIPAQQVESLIPQFREKEIHNMLLITSGFAETGKNGKALERSLLQQASAADILMVGPNTMGICNPHINLYCTGSHVRPQPGSTAVVAQSGNMGNQLLAFAEYQGIGIRAFCGSGNEAMITIEDYLDAFENDPLTRTVMLYIESVKNGRRFMNSALRVGKKKPIILLKGGRSQAGNRAAESHTGAMSSDSSVFDAICRQSGIVEVERPMDLLDLSAAFSSLPLPRGNRAAIMTLGGGWGVVTADLCSDYHLEIPALPAEIIDRFDSLLPSYWSRANPIDIVGEMDTSLPMTILEELLRWEGCDAVINLGILGRRILLERLTESISKADPTYSREFLKAAIQSYVEFEENYITHIIKLMETYEKPIFGVSMLFDKKEQTVYRVKDSSFKGVFYATPERAVKAFAKMYEYKRFLSR